MCDPGQHFTGVKSRGGRFEPRTTRTRSAFVDDEAAASDDDGAASADSGSAQNISRLIDDNDDEAQSGSSLHPGQVCSAALVDSDADDGDGPGPARRQRVLDDSGDEEPPAAPQDARDNEDHAPQPPAPPPPPPPAEDANQAPAPGPGAYFDFSALEDLLDTPADKAALRKLLPRLSGPVRCLLSGCSCAHCSDETQHDDLLALHTV